MSATLDKYLDIKHKKHRDPLAQKIAHDDNAKPISVKKCRNGTSVRWACGCSIFEYNPDRHGRQAVRNHFCNQGGRWDKVKDTLFPKP